MNTNNEHLRGRKAGFAFWQGMEAKENSRDRRAEEFCVSRFKLPGNLIMEIFIPGKSEASSRGTTTRMERPIKQRFPLSRELEFL